MQQLVEVAEVVVGLDQPADPAVERVDLLVQGLEDAADPAPRRRAGGDAAAVALLGPHVQQLPGTPAIHRRGPSAGHQRLEFRPVLRPFLRQPRRGQPCELHQHAGVDGVGLGQLADAPGEVPHVAGIDQGHRQVRLEQRVDQRPLQAAEQGFALAPGGLDDDDRQGGAGGAELLHDLSHAGVVVGEGDDSVGIRARQVQLVFGDVDADKQVWIRGVGHGGPFLRMRASCGEELCRLFGRSDTTPAWTTLRDGRMRPRRDRPWGRRSCQRDGSLRSPPRGHDEKLLELDEGILNIEDAEARRGRKED